MLAQHHPRSLAVGAALGAALGVVVTVAVHEGAVTLRNDQDTLVGGYQDLPRPFVATDDTGQTGRRVGEQVQFFEDGSTLVGQTLRLSVEVKDICGHTVADAHTPQAATCNRKQRASCTCLSSSNRVWESRASVLTSSSATCMGQAHIKMAGPQDSV